MKNLHLSKGANLVEIVSGRCTFCNEIKDVMRRTGYSGASVCSECAEQIATLIKDNTPYPDQIDMPSDEDTPF